jgi:ABC-type multidrug transport system fused ATPase/permease subunit
MFVVCASLAVVERLAALASVVTWQTSTFRFSVVALGGAALLHRALRVRLRTTATASAFARVVERTATDDGVAALDDQSAPMAIVEAVHHAARGLADVAVPLVADVIATIVGLAIVARMGGIGALGALSLAVVGVLASRVLSRPADAAFERYMNMIEGVVDAFDGRGELLASGNGPRFATDVRAAVERWRATTLVADFKSAIASRFPLVVLAAIAIGLAVTRGLNAALLPQALILLTVSSVFVGAARGVFELSRLPTRVDAIVPIVALSSRARTGAAPKSCAVEWRDARIAYGERGVLANVSLRLDKGEIVALAGPNGAGKTTLLLTALGLKRPESGELSLGGVRADEIDVLAWRRSVAYLAQRPYLLPHRDVRSAMRFPSTDLSDAEIMRACTRAGVLERLQTFPGDPLAVGTDRLSAGERQRLAIARMLTKECDVYVLDEPDANLDAQGVSLVVELLGELRATGKLILVAAHTREVLDAADRVVHLATGRVASIEQRSSQRHMKAIGAARNESC